MSYDQYWNDDVWLIWAYREADKIRRKRQNQLLWLQGMYVYDALCDVSPLLHAFAKKGTKATPYRSAPYPLFGEKESNDEHAKEQEKELLMAKLYMKNMVRAGKHWGKK